MPAGDVKESLSDPANIVRSLLVHLKVDLILGEGALVTRAAQHATGTIPIVFAAITAQLA